MHVIILCTLVQVYIHSYSAISQTALCFIGSTHYRTGKAVTLELEQVILETPFPRYNSLASHST
jgi:hypothetical protein